MGKVIRSIVIVLFLSVAGQLSAARREAPASTRQDKEENLYNYLSACAFDQFLNNNHSLAFEYYRQALEVNPQSGDASYRLAFYYSSLNNYPKALEMAQAAVAADSTNLNYIAFLSVLYYDSHQEEKTLQLLESAVGFAGSIEDRIQFLRMIYSVYSGNSDLPQMLKTLLRIQELEGETIESLMQQVNIYGALGNVDSVKTCVERLVAADPSVEDEFLAMLAEAYWNNNMDNEARKIYNTILERFPHSLNGRLSMIDFYSARHEQENFANTFISLVTDKTVEIDIRSGLLENLIALNRNLWGEAMNFYKRIFDTYFQFEPDDISNMNNYAYSMCLIDSTDLDYYFSLSGKTIKAEPQNATFLDTYAWIAFLLGKSGVAKEYIDLAIRYSGNIINVEMYDHAGDIYLKSGLKAQACDFWEKAINVLIHNRSEGFNNSTIDSMQQKIRNSRK